MAPLICFGSQLPSSVCSNQSGHLAIGGKAQCDQLPFVQFADPLTA